MKKIINMINYETFKLIELKVGKVVSAQRVEGSDKLIKMQVKLGDDVRQIIAGIGKKYQSEMIIDKNIVIVTNLEPKKFKIKNGEEETLLESQGMLLAASGVDGNLSLLTTMEEIESGSEVG